MHKTSLIHIYFFSTSVNPKKKFTWLRRDKMTQLSGISYCTQKNRFLVTFKLKRIWSWWLFSCLIVNLTEFCLDKNQKENCHYDHIPFNLKVIYIYIFLWFALPRHIIFFWIYFFMFFIFCIYYLWLNWYDSCIWSIQ